MCGTIVGAVAMAPDARRFPLNVLNVIKMVPEVCRIFCAMDNPTEAILAQTEQGRGIFGVVDGFAGLRRIGYTR